MEVWITWRSSIASHKWEDHVSYKENAFVKWKKKKKNGDEKLYLSPNRAYGKIMHGHKQMEIL